MKTLLLTLALLAGTAAVPEPAGFRMDNYNAAVPDTLRGGTVLHSAALISTIARLHPVLIDVLPAPRRPEGMAPGTPWLPLPHKDIPGSIWLPDVGRGAISADLAKFFEDRLASLSGRDRNRSMVFYCRANCWMSWNAAHRAILLGYHHVAWYPDGVEGWQGAGQPVVTATPQTP